MEYRSIRVNFRMAAVLAVVVLLSITASVCAFENHAKAAAVKKAVVNTDGLNVRTGAATSFSPVMHAGKGIKLNCGAIVNIISEDKNGWSQITFDYFGKSYTGYAASMYISVERGKYAVKGVLAKASVKQKQKVLKAPKKKAAQLVSGGKKIKLKKNSRITIDTVKLVKGTYWYGIRFTRNGQTLRGYINSQYAALLKGKVPAVITKATPVSRTAGKNVYIKQKKKTVKLKKNSKITILKEKTVKGVKYFYIKASVKKKTVKGYIKSSSAMFLKTETAVKVPDTNNTNDIPFVPLSDAEFEADMSAQGFPESYKPYLRKLHANYPYWQFKAYNTGLDFADAVANEAKTGKSLISNAKGHGWKSHEKDAYDWANDKYKIFDGSTWVAASREAVAYYMDPRNFLTDKVIFMFEALNYEPLSHNANGVNILLSNSIFRNASYTYKDDSGNDVQTTYADTFMAAAELYNISPYHLASRVKQEVVTGTSTVSGAVTGQYPGYEGIYNFYNIGATDGADGGALVRGLIFASTGSTYMRPWNNPYKAIVGGGQYIANNYIAKGQNTIYLERFNVTPVNTYEHQYMTNVSAAFTESQRIYDAYKSFMTNMPMVFNIPVYNNMPESVSAIPNTNANPNNYLKSLSLTGNATQSIYAAEIIYNYNPGVDDGVYNIAVSAAETSVNMSAVPVNAAAKVEGAGEIPLSDITTVVKITVTAENGDAKVYTVNITKM